MNVYFLRHGETELNKEKVHQPAHTELSREGLKQAENVGKFLKDLGIETIYSSPLTRALQTTEVVRKIIGAPVIMNDDLKEIRRPSAIVGQKHDINEVVEIKRKIRDYYPIEHWHHSDEENFFDLKKRANSFKQLLENTIYENVLAVSHGMIIKLFIALVIFGDKLTPHEFLDFYDNTSLSNTGISVCELSKENTWKLVSLNTTTHNNT
jgi:broad specificity phosphatase PhoE